MSSSALSALVAGAGVTVELTFYAVLLGTAIALVGGLASLSGNRLVRWVTVVYVEVFRGVAALILLLFAFYALPLLLGLELSQLTAGVLAIGTNMGAYGTEVVRGAIRGVPTGQTEAAITCNLTPAQRMRHVILPQALVAMIPPYGDLCIMAMKASALVSVIAMSDLTRAAQGLRTDPASSTVEIYAVALVLYFAIGQGINLGARLLARVVDRGGQATRPVRAGVR